MRHCDFCHEASSSLKECSRCRSMSYCSKRCQRNGWRAHKEWCNHLADVPTDDVASTVKKTNAGSSDHADQNPIQIKTSHKTSSQSCQKKDWLDNHQRTCLSLEKEPNKISGQEVPALTKTTHLARKPAHGGEKARDVCQWCQKAVESSLTCSKCRMVVYCSITCQQKDWKLEHKDTCNELQRCTEKQTNRLTSLDIRQSEIKDNERTESGSVQFCYWCHVALSSPLRCSGCKKAVYCSKACQQRDWKPGHKHICNSIKKAAEMQSNIPADQNVSWETSKGTSQGIPAPETNGPSPEPFAKAGARPREDTKTVTIPACKQCNRQDRDLLSCARCKEVSYCSKDCQRMDWPGHKTECVSIDGVIKTKKYKKNKDNDAAKGATEVEQNPSTLMDYLLMGMGILPEYSHPRMSWSEAKRVTQMNNVGYAIVESFDEIPVELLWMTPVTRGRVLLAKISRMHPYQIRHSIYLKDIENNETFVMFYLDYNNPEPFFSWLNLQLGNYFCLKNPVFHNFLDGTVGIRVDEASDVKVI